MAKVYFGFEYHADSKLPFRAMVSGKPKAPNPKSEKQKKEKAPEYSDDSFEKLQEAFFDQMHAFLDIFPTATELVPIMQSSWIANFEQKSVGKKAINTTKDGDWTFYEIDSKHFSKLSKEFDKATRSADALRVFPQLTLLGLVSQFDAYMGRLLRLAIQHKPHIIFQSQKSFPAHEVFQYTDVETFKEAVIEKEIEDFLRKSHEDQFNWIKEKFEVKTIEGLECWPKFMEACERRNLFAHSNGFVSQQYIIKCTGAGGDVKVKKGDKLVVSPEYLKETCKVFIEIGLKVAQVISRKILDNDEQFKAADDCLNAISYSLLEHEHYDLACCLLDFACDTLKKHPNMFVFNMMVVNRANCYKFLGENEKSDKILNSVDWTPYDGMFQISVEAVRGNAKRVAALMPKNKGHEYLTMNAYREWPVFHWVRESVVFSKAFSATFGEPLIEKSTEETKVIDGETRILQ